MRENKRIFFVFDAESVGKKTEKIKEIDGSQTGGGDPSRRDADGRRASKSEGEQTGHSLLSRTNVLYCVISPPPVMK